MVYNSGLNRLFSNLSLLIRSASIGEGFQAFSVFAGVNSCQLFVSYESLFWLFANTVGWHRVIDWKGKHAFGGGYFRMAGQRCD